MTYRKPRLHINARKVSNALDATGKFVANQHSEINDATYRRVRVMSTQQEINFLLASCRWLNRRMRSSNKAHARLVATGKEDGFIRTTYEWVIDFIVVSLGFIWSFIRTILIFFWMIIYQVLLIIFFTAIVFFLVYALFTS